MIDSYFLKISRNVSCIFPSQNCVLQKNVSKYLENIHKFLKVNTKNFSYFNICHKYALTLIKLHKFLKQIPKNSHLPIFLTGLHRLINNAHLNILFVFKNANAFQIYLKHFETHATKTWRNTLIYFCN